MTVRPKATFAAAGMQDDADLLDEDSRRDEPKLPQTVRRWIERRLERPVDVCEQLELAWSPKYGGRVTLGPELRERLRFGLGAFTHEQQGQDAREADEQAGAIMDAVGDLRAALRGCGKDLHARIEHELGYPAVDAFCPILLEAERLEGAVRRARDRLPEHRGPRGPTILDPLTRILAEIYVLATGRKPGTGPDGPFVRGVLVVHDSLPLRLQQQNPPGTPAEQIRLRGGDEYRQAVVTALGRMTKEGEWHRLEREHAAHRQRLAEAVRWLDAHAEARAVLRALSEAGGWVAVGDDRLPPHTEGELAAAGLVQRFSGSLVGLTRSGEEALERGERPEAARP
jgi:hypothetical protein